MKLKINNNEYAASNVSLKLSADCKQVSAYSYSWWQFVATDAVGNIVFNHYRYSKSTSKHQYNVASILRRLGLTAALTLTKTNESLSNLTDAIADEITQWQHHITDLQAAIVHKGSKRRKNEERRAEIIATEYKIKDLQRYLSEYSDKQLLPVSAVASEYFATEYAADYKRYFLKPNGKLKTNEFNAFVARCDHSNAAPDSIGKIKDLLQIKTVEQITTVLLYRFCNDLEQQLPAIDTAEYKQLQRWLQRNNIARDTLNLLALDKIHVYLTNKCNRKSYVPSEPNYFPMHPALAALRSIDGLTLIASDRDLRAEGRRQSHCIGGQNYVSKCRAGYQALNYKGYTFFLSPTLDLIETHGRHNSWTPENISNELMAMIRKQLRQAA